MDCLCIFKVTIVGSKQNIWFVWFFENSVTRLEPGFTGYIVRLGSGNTCLGVHPDPGSSSNSNF